jgi:hypothetical protein
MSLFAQDGIRRKRKDFEIDAAWKCGVWVGDDVVQQTLDYSCRSQEISGRGIQRARKVDKAAFWTTFDQVL